MRDHVPVVWPNGRELLGIEDIIQLTFKHVNDLFKLEAAINSIANPHHIATSGWQEEVNKFYFLTVEQMNSIEHWIVHKVAVGDNQYWQVHKTINGKRYRKHICRVGEMRLPDIYDAIEYIKDKAKEDNDG